MRNQPKPLNLTDAKQAMTMREALSSSTAPVRVDYVKRNGQASSSTGTVGFFSGTPGYDTESVTLHTEDKGPRTINLHRITRLSVSYL